MLKVLIIVVLFIILANGKLANRGYVPDQYKTQKLCDKAILENGRTLKSVPNCYKNQKMFDKAVANYTLMH